VSRGESICTHAATDLFDPQQGKLVLRRGVLRGDNKPMVWLPQPLQLSTSANSQDVALKKKEVQRTGNEDIEKGSYNKVGRDLYSQKIGT